MIPRYNLYGDMDIWADDIQLDLDGAWCKYRDIEPIIEQLIALGGSQDVAKAPPCTRYDNSFVEHYESSVDKPAREKDIDDKESIE